MINKKSIITFIFLLNLGTGQINASQIHQKLNSGTIDQTKPENALMGKRSESRAVPAYFKFKQKQTRSFEQLPNELKYIIGQFVGFDQPAHKNSNLLPFNYVMRDYDCNAIQVLVALRADLHDPKGQFEHQKTTPLFSAIEEYKIDCNDPKCRPERKKQILAIIDYLLRKKIGINKPVKYETTPLHLAVNLGLVDITQRLITAQADLGVLNDSNKTPLDIAKNNAMQRSIHPESRKNSYAICTILEQAAAAGSVISTPMPTDKKMAEEYASERQRYNNRNWW